VVVQSVCTRLDELGLNDLIGVHRERIGIGIGLQQFALIVVYFLLEFGRILHVIVVVHGIARVALVEGGVGISISFSAVNFRSNCPTESKVAYFGETVLVDENVVGFDVPVHDTALVHLVESIYDVPH